MLRWRASLKLRLMLLITALIGLFCVAAGIYIVKRAQADIRGEVYSATELIQHYLSAQLTLARSDWRQDSERVPTFHLEQLRDIRHAEVYFYNAVGTLLESSADDTAPEAAAPGWFVWLVQRSFTSIPDQRRFVGFDGFAVGLLVIHPIPEYEIDEIWEVTRGLLGLLLVFALLVNSFVWWAVGRALRPLDAIRGAVSELSAGRLATRLPVIDLPELASLSREFNGMAQTLEHSTQENHRLTRRLIQVQEEERERLARELHDEIGQCVTAIHADAFSIQRASRAGEVVIQESAAAIMEVTARIKTMVRGMLQRLRPAAIERLGFEGALRELETSFRQRNPDTLCTLSVHGDAERIDKDLAMAIYRLVQEGLTNVARHAGARHVTVKVEAGERLAVSLRDDGRGFDPESISEGFGLLGMRERTMGFGGTMTLESAAGQGSVIRAVFPWDM